MVTEITSKQQLETLASELRNKSNQLATDISSIISTLNGISDYDGINISQAANTLANNLQTVTSSLNGVVTGISSYAQQVNTIDVYGLSNEPALNEGVNNSGNNIDNNGSSVVYDNGSNSGNNTGNNTSENINVPIAAVPIVGSNNNSSNNNSNKEQINSGQRAERVSIYMGDKNYQVLGKYTNDPSRGFNVTTGNFAYELTDKDFDLLCAIVAGEGNLSYDENLALVSTILNRCDNGEFITMFGKDPIAQITGLNQFTSYGNGSYKSYLNGKAPIEVINAVKDALAGVRNHNLCNYKLN